MYYPNEKRKIRLNDYSKFLEAYSSSSSAALAFAFFSSLLKRLIAFINEDAFHNSRVTFKTSTFQYFQETDFVCLLYRHFSAN